MGLLQRRRAEESRGDVDALAELASTHARIAQLELDLERARTSLDNLPIGVVLVDARGAEMLRNERSHQSTGHGEVLVQEAVDRHVQLALRGRESRSSVELLAHRDGSSR